MSLFEKFQKNITSTHTSQTIRMGIKIIQETKFHISCCFQGNDDSSHGLLGSYTNILENHTVCIFILGSYHISTQHNNPEDQ